jgi:hypothetical protein
VDHFVSVVHENSKRRRQVKRSLFEALDSVFLSLLSTNHPHRQELASIKNMLKGDGTWATRKLVLGLNLDSAVNTIQLLPHRVKRLQEILTSLPRTRTQVSAKNWHQNR